MTERIEERCQLTFRDICGSVIEKIKARIEDLGKQPKYTRRLLGFPDIEKKLKATIRNMRQDSVSNVDIIEARDFITEAGYTFREKFSDESFKAFRERMGDSELVFVKIEEGGCG
jgi:hypothetical protein